MDRAALCCCALGSLASAAAARGGPAGVALIVQVHVVLLVHVDASVALATATAVATAHSGADVLAPATFAARSPAGATFRRNPCH